MKRTYSSLLITATVVALLLVSSGASAQAPSLGTAADYSVLAGSTVTNTGSTTVVGQLGVSPGSAVTGFPPGTVTLGTIHSNDASAIGAQSDVGIAYGLLAGLPCSGGNVLTGQDLGGKTLVAGVYCFATSAQLTGTLILDAQGDPNSQFIFQVGTTLTTASNSLVRVINGGSNCNVYWQVGSSATLGTSTTLVGNILAQASITLNTTANVSGGRLLARTGAVTLDSNNVAICPACDPIVLSPSTLPNGTIGTAYSQTITASGGTAPYTFSVLSGTLPAGLSLSAGGALTGTPTTAVSSTFTVRAVDAAGCFGSRVYTIVINAASCPAITLSPSTLPAATTGTAYSQTITASGGTGAKTFAVTAGSLPPGLALSTGGVLSGTPTLSGSFTFTVTATDTLGCIGSQIYTVLVNCPVITLAPAALPNGTISVAYSQVITASGGTPAYAFTVVLGTLPAGLSLTTGGTLAGTPTATGSSTFTVRATDANGCLGERIYTLIIGAVGCPVITLAPATLLAGTTGVAYSQLITASGGTAPYTFALSSGTLPPGLSLATGGLLSGTPTRAGGYTFTVTATATGGCLGSIVYTLSMGCPAITIAPTTLPSGTVNVPYSQTITASGGTAPYTFAVTSGALPAGLTLSSGGVLSGLPTGLGGVPFTITATDSAGCLAARTFTITFSAPAGGPTLDSVGLALLVLLLAAAGVVLVNRFTV